LKYIYINTATYTKLHSSSSQEVTEKDLTNIITCVAKVRAPK